MKTNDKKPRPNWRPFDDARTFVCSLQLKNKDEWVAWAKSDARPNNIPASPSVFYKGKGWAGWGDWLGTRNRKGGYRSFQEARIFVRSLQLQNNTEWNAWAKSNARPDDIPANPGGVYKEKGWKGVGDWLGTGRIATFDIVYRSFEEARAFVHSLEIKGYEEWKTWAKSEACPSDLPAYPNAVYENKGWKDWGDWLGTGRIANQNIVYRPFQEARIFVHSLGLQNGAEWQSWAKSEARPSDIPATPGHVYQEKGWVGLGDWLGTGRIAAQNMVYRSFEEARTFAHSLGLQNGDEWQSWAKSEARPSDIPAGPRRVYMDNGWAGWGDWLGTGRIANRNKIYRPFEEARAFVHSLKLIDKSNQVRTIKIAVIIADLRFGCPKSSCFVHKGWG